MRVREIFSIKKRLKWNAKWTVWVGKRAKKEVIILSEYDLSMGCQQTT